MYSSVPATQSFINVGSAKKGTNVKGNPSLLTFPTKGQSKNVAGEGGMTNSPSLINLSPQSSQKKLFPFSATKQ